MIFCGIGFYLFFYFKNLDYLFIFYYFIEDGDLCFRIMYIFCGNRLESDSRLVCVFMEMVI